MSKLFLKNKKCKKSANNNDGAENAIEQIDFDNPSTDCGIQECKIEFPLEEDIINLGSWILIYHPNFFNGSGKAALRYTFYFINSVVILSIQLIFLMYFNFTAMNDMMVLFTMFNKI